MKMRQNNVTNRIDLVYIEIEIELVWPIWLSAVYEENQIGQLDRSFKCVPRQKQYWTVMTNRIGCWLWWKLDRRTMWLIVQMQSTLKMKLNYHDWSDHVQSMMKTKQDNDMTDHIGLVYAKIKTELLWAIWPSAIYDENQIGKGCDWSYRCGLRQKWKLSYRD